MVALKAKAAVKIGMHHGKLTQDVRSLQSGNFSLFLVQSVSRQYICIVFLQHKGKWMSFLSEFMLLIEP